MKTVILPEGCVVPYFEKGNGPLLFLVHGFGGFHSDWFPIVDELSTHFRVIVPNFSHEFYGLHRDGQLRTFTSHVKLLKSFVEHISGSETQRFVAGASYGGALCWAVLIDSPQWVKACSLLGPMPPNPVQKIQNKTLQAMLYWIKYPLLFQLYLQSPLGRIRLPLIESIFHAPWSRPGKKRVLAKLTRRKVVAITHVAKAFSTIIKGEDWAYWESRLFQIKTPVSIIYGTDDRVFVEGVNIQLHHGIQNSELQVVENAGHLVMREQPQEVVQKLLKFFKAHP